MNTKIFVSFQRGSWIRASWIAERLQAEEFIVSLEDEFGADPPRREIGTAIQACDVVVALISPAYAEASATLRELDYAEAFNKKIIAVFVGLPSRACEAQPFTPYRRVELAGDWLDSSEQWEQIIVLLIKALKAERTRSLAHSSRSMEMGSSVDIPQDAILIYDLEDRAIADSVLKSQRIWRRANGSTETVEVPHVLLWTAASSEPSSLAQRSFRRLNDQSRGLLLVTPDSPAVDMDTNSILHTIDILKPEPASLAKARSSEVSAGAEVANLTERLKILNENTPLDVFMDRFCSSADVEDVARLAFSVAIRELRAGDLLRLTAVHNYVLAMRFHGSWRQAVEIMENELLATPSTLTIPTESLVSKLRLEKLSLEYELGDHRSAGLKDEIEAIQLAFRKMGELQGYVQAGRILGNVLREQGDYVKAERTIERTIGVAEYLTDDGEQNHGDLMLADCLRELAQLHIARLDFTKARECIDDASLLLLAGTGEVNSANRYLRAVMTYVEATLTERDASQTAADPPTERAQGALETLSVFENPIRVATIYDWLGRAWSSRVPSRHDDLVLAERYLRKALRIRQTHGHNYTLGVSHMSLGGLYEVLGDIDIAIESYEEGRRIFNERGLRPALAKSHAALARAYFRKYRASADGAEQLYRRNLQLAEEHYHELDLDNEGLELRFELEHTGRQALHEVADSTPLVAVGEYYFHKWIREYVSVNSPKIREGFELVKGVGDDAAVLGVASSDDLQLVFTTDAAPGSLAEPSRSPKYVGRFTVVQTLSDVIAMGGIPVALLVNLFFVRSVTVGYARELIEAIVAEAARYGVTVIGGDVKERGEQSVGCVAFGHVDKLKTLLRSAVRPGHAIGITLASDPSGTGSRLIGSRWAQELVEYFEMSSPGIRSAFPELEHVIDSSAKYDLLYLPDRVMRCAVDTGLMRAAMDTSDGVLACLELLGRESQVGFELYETEIDNIIDSKARALANVLGIPAMLFLFNAGHDWEVVFSCEEKDFDAISRSVDSDLGGNGCVIRLGRARERMNEDDRGINIKRSNGNSIMLPFYTDEKFVPRRYQDRPSQWLSFASRFGPRNGDAKRL